MMAVFVAVTGAALAHVSLRLGVVRMGYAIGEQTRERRRLEEEARHLSIQLAELKRPDRIEALARAQGMTLPDAAHIRTLRPGTVTVAARSAPGARVAQEPAAQP
jgi:cell division protein FtsL